MTFYAAHILGPDTHANRPAASGVPDAAQYRCSTHDKTYVNRAGTWVDYQTNTSPTAAKTINPQTGTSYTLVAGDAGAFVTMTNAGASTLTVPPNSSVAFAVGTVIEGAQLGAGQVTLTPGSGVTINGAPGLNVAAQYGTFGLLKIATDTWLAFGRLAA